MVDVEAGIAWRYLYCLPYQIHHGLKIASLSSEETQAVVRLIVFLLNLEFALIQGLSC